MSGVGTHEVSVAAHKVSVATHLGENLHAHILNLTLWSRFGSPLFTHSDLNLYIILRHSDLRLYIIELSIELSMELSIELSCHRLVFFPHTTPHTTLLSAPVGGPRPSDGGGDLGLDWPGHFSHRHGRSWVSSAP